MVDFLTAVETVNIVCRKWSWMHVLVLKPHDNDRPESCASSLKPCSSLHVAFPNIFIQSSDHLENIMCTFVCHVNVKLCLGTWLLIEVEYRAIKSLVSVMRRLDTFAIKHSWEKIIWFHWLYCICFAVSTYPPKASHNINFGTFWMHAKLSRNNHTYLNFSKICTL